MPFSDVIGAGVAFFAVGFGAALVPVVAFAMLRRLRQSLSAAAKQESERDDLE